MLRLKFEIRTDGVEKDKVILDEDAFERLVSLLSDEDTFVLDVETEASRLVGIGFAFMDKKAFYLPFMDNFIRKELIVNVLDSLFKNEEKTIIGHNLKYDLKVLYSEGVKEGLLSRKTSFEDTQILGWLLDSRRVNEKDGLSLDGLCRFYKIKGKSKKFSEVDFLSLKDVSEYCIQDCLATLCLYKTLISEISEDKKLVQVYDIEKRLIPYVAILELSGVVVSVPQIKEIDKKITRELTSLALELGFNPESQLEVLRNLPEKIKSKLSPGKVRQKTDRKELSAFQGNPLIDKILDYRSLSKIKSTFGIPMLQKAKVVGDKALVNAEFRQDGTVSGRFKSKDPNLQNIPIRTEIGSLLRKAFVPRSDGNVFLIADASQIEFRCLAFISKEKTLIDIFNSGEDLHQATANLLNIPRYQAKTVNFAIIYGVSPASLAKTLGITEEATQELIENFYENYPQVKRLKEFVEYKVRNAGEIRTYFGRKRLFKKEEVTNSVLRQAFNFVCQGTAIDIVKLSMVLCYENTNIKSVPVLQVHDEIVFETTKGRAEKEAEIIKKTLTNSPLIKNLPVKIEYDLVILNSWGGK